MRLTLLMLAVSLSASTVSAAPRREGASDELERLELAREHFQRGEQLQAEGKLEAALLELELAEVAHPSTSVNEAKQRIRARLEAQRAQAAPVAVAASAPSAPPRGRPLRRFIAPIVLAPFAVGALVAGGVLLATVRSDFARLQDTCSPGCDPDQVAPLRTREGAALGLLAAGGALAVVDAVLWGVLARRAPAGPRASLLPTTSGATVTLGGAF